jgi:hypothetical protein
MAGIAPIRASVDSAPTTTRSNLRAHRQDSDLTTVRFGDLPGLLDRVLVQLIDQPIDGPRSSVPSPDFSFRRPADA